jgi:predicted DNA binding CopG/RHH family protein
MTKKLKKLPDFSKMTPKEEALFWDEADLTDYIDEREIVKNKLKLILKDSSAKDELVSFRLQNSDLVMLKTRAQKLGIGHSTLLRMLIRRFLTNPDQGSS